MTLQQLKYIITIADKASMCEAAKCLFLSQPTLSNAVKDLETEIGLRIFDRTNKGINITVEGKRFLGYARQVVEQTQLLEEEYLGGKKPKQKFSVSTQHYSFAVNAFVELIQTYDAKKYDFTLRETRTFEIIDDVRNFRSEIGILYLNDFNRKVIEKILKESDLVFKELFIAKPHVFVSSSNPIAACQSVTWEKLENYPCLSFEQGDNNSFYFAEEICSTMEHEKCIRVSDRATLFNLLIGLNGYTICTGIISEDLNGKNIIAIPLEEEEHMHVGYITHKNAVFSKMAEIYMEALRRYIPHDLP